MVKVHSAQKRTDSGELTKKTTHCESRDFSSKTPIKGERFR